MVWASAGAAGARLQAALLTELLSVLQMPAGLNALWLKTEAW